MDEHESRIATLQALHCFRPAMGGTVIDDPENPASLVVGWPCHYLFDQPVKGIDAIFGLAAAKNPGMMDVESGKVGPCSTAKILMLDAHASTRPASVSGVFAAARLNAGFFVRGNDKLIVFQWITVPFASVQVQ